MNILQIENGQIKDAPVWLYKNELHKNAIIFPFIMHHREVPTSDYPCAICGKPLGPRQYFTKTFIHNEQPPDYFTSYVYTHVKCMAARFKQNRNSSPNIDISNELQGSLFEGVTI